MQRVRRAAAAKATAKKPAGVDAGPVDDDAKLDAIAEVSLRCLLCNGPEAVRLFFVPKDRRRVPPRGRGQAFRYSLCASCFSDPGHVRRAEERIFARLAAMDRVN
jgi:hypothetical protein